MAAPYGLDQPNYAPYEEAANYGRARRSTLQRIALALAGAGQGIQSVQQGYGPLGSALTGFSRGYILSNASKRAAEEYAMKQQKADEDREFRELQKLDLQGEIEARNKRMSTPEKPRVLEDWERTPEEQAKIIDYQKRLKAATAKEDKPEKPNIDEVRVRQIQARIDDINALDPNDPIEAQLLRKIVANPATPEEGKAASAKLQIAPGFFRWQPPPTPDQLNARGKK
jgi:hypothetical protein